MRNRLRPTTIRVFLIKNLKKLGRIIGNSRATVGSLFEHQKEKEQRYLVLDKIIKDVTVLSDNYFFSNITKVEKLITLIMKTHATILANVVEKKRTKSTTAKALLGILETLCEHLSAAKRIIFSAKLSKLTTTLPISKFEFNDTMLQIEKQIVEAQITISNNNNLANANSNNNTSNYFTKL